MKLLALFFTSLGLFLLSACTKDVGPNPDLVIQTTNKCDSVSFTLNIKPIITNYCATSGCHVLGAQSPNFSDDNEVKSQADGGRIKARLIDQNDMPPAGNASPTSEEISLIKCWLDAGAPLN